MADRGATSKPGRRQPRLRILDAEEVRSPWSMVNQHHVRSKYRSGSVEESRGSRGVNPGTIERCGHRSLCHCCLSDVGDAKLRVALGPFGEQHDRGENC